MLSTLLILVPSPRTITLIEINVAQDIQPVLTTIPAGMLREGRELTFNECMQILNFQM